VRPGMRPKAWPASTSTFPGCASMSTKSPTSKRPSPWAWASTRRARWGATLTIVQATIHSTGDEGGQALLDDGSLIDWDLASVAGSGLRHLRVGQRVSVELDDEDRRARRMWIVGIGAGQVIS